MDTALKIYLSGVIVSAILCFILTIAKKEVRVFDIISVLLNIICSWATPISLLGMAINSLLNFSNLNKILWKTKEDKSDHQRIIRKK